LFRPAVSQGWQASANAKCKCKCACKCTCTCKSKWKMQTKHPLASVRCQTGSTSPDRDRVRERTVRISPSPSSSYSAPFTHEGEKLALGKIRHTSNNLGVVESESMWQTNERPPGGCPSNFKQRELSTSYTAGRTKGARERTNERTQTNKRTNDRAEVRSGLGQWSVIPDLAKLYEADHVGAIINKMKMHWKNNRNRKSTNA